MFFFIKGNWDEALKSLNCAVSAISLADYYQKDGEVLGLRADCFLKLVCFIDFLLIRHFSHKKYNWTIYNYFFFAEPTCRSDC